MATENDFTRGDMDIGLQASTYSGFMRLAVWASALLAVLLLFLTLVFAVGAPWAPSLVGCALLGFVLGFFLKLRGAWYGTIVGLTVLGLIIGGVIGLLRHFFVAG